MNQQHDRDGAFGPPAQIPGMVRYFGELAQQGYRLTRFLVEIALPDNRSRYLSDEETAMAQAGLSDLERGMVRHRDYVSMLEYGVNVYALAKAGNVFGHGLLEVGDIMRGAAHDSEK